jgi:hypothetical protein
MTKSMRDATMDKGRSDLARGDPGLRLQVLTEAIACLEAKEFERAERFARQATCIEARDPDAWHLVGVALAQQGQYAGAAEAIGRAIALNPGAAQFHVNLGNAHFEQAHYAGNRLLSRAFSSILRPRRRASCSRGPRKGPSPPRPSCTRWHTSRIMMSRRTRTGRELTWVPGGFAARVHALGRPHGSEIYPLANFADNSVDEVRASHCLEHFPHRQVRLS